MKPRTLKITAVVVFAGIGVSLVLGLYGKGVAISKAQSISCLKTIGSIGIAARLWANDREHLMPTNFICMSNEVITPKILHCPADHKNPRVIEWAEFTEAKSSYLMISPGVREGGTNVVFIRCRVHGHLGFPDGSARRAD